MSEGRLPMMRRIARCCAGWVAGLRQRRRGGPADVTCETLAGVEPGSAVTFKGRSWRRKRPGRLSSAVTALRDAYVSLMVRAADHPGDMSGLVYGNAYAGTDFRFSSSFAGGTDEDIAACHSQRSST